MTQLLLAVYAGEDTAEHVLGVLRAQADELTASLESAAIIRVRADRSFTVIRTEYANSSGSFWGVFWEALFGLVFREPARAPAIDSNVGQLFGIIERAGLDERFRARVRRALRSGTSALGIVALNWTTEAMLNQLFLRPAASVRARLSPEQEVELLKELGRFPAHDEESPEMGGAAPSTERQTRTDAEVWEEEEQEA
jgi:uncharacterized membrane protein